MTPITFENLYARSQNILKAQGITHWEQIPADLAKMRDWESWTKQKNKIAGIDYWLWLTPHYIRNINYAREKALWNT